MLIFGLGIGMMIGGIIALVTGRMKLTGTRAVQGVPARLLGAALIIPFPASFLVAMIYTLAHVDPNKPDQAQAWAQQNDTRLTLIMAGTMIGMALLIILIAAIIAKPIKPARRRKRRVNYDDYESDEAPPRRSRRDEYDARPRRRRVDDDLDENDDRPRRRRDDEDDRPRRRRDDLDDRAR